MFMKSDLLIGNYRINGAQINWIGPISDNQFETDGSL